MKRLSIIQEQKFVRPNSRDSESKFFELGEIELDDSGQIASFELFRGLPQNTRLIIGEASKFNPLISFKQKK